MNYYFFGLLAISTFLFSACKKDARETPTCIWNKITAFDSSFECAEAKVDKYIFFTKSLKCTRSAFTEILISQNEIPKEISNANILNPKK